MKFEIGDEVIILPFELKGKREKHYDSEMVAFIGRKGIMSDTSCSKPKYRVDFYDKDGSRSGCRWFFSSDLELDSGEELGEHECP